MKEIFEKVKNDTEKHFLDARGSHDWDHTQRVLKLCVHIGEKEKADLDILKLAAILHDIGREHECQSSGKVCHAEIGANIARNKLQEYGLDKDNIEKIVHCIECHRFRDNKIPQSLEAKILFDSDKLDAIGAVGIGRAFLFSGEVGAKLHNDKNVDIFKTEAYSKEDTAYREYVVKLRNIKDKILTQEGKRIAQERHDFMVEFFDRLCREIDGEL